MRQELDFGLQVECSAGHRGEPTPDAILVRRRDQRRDTWLAPNHGYFKIHGDDGACYILRNDVMSDRWYLAVK